MFNWRVFVWVDWVLGRASVSIFVCGGVLGFPISKLLVRGYALSDDIVCIGVVWRCSFINRLVCFGPFETFVNLHLLPMNWFSYYIWVVSAL